MMEKFEYDDPGAPVVLIQPVDDHDLSFLDSEVRIIESRTDADFRLVALKVNDWNSDLSPWKTPPAFGKDGFGDGARATLDEILDIVRDQKKHILSAAILSRGCSRCGRRIRPTLSAASRRRPHRCGFPDLRTTWKNVKYKAARYI